MVASISCPVCSEVVEDRECPSCNTDLEPLLRVQRTAYRLAGKALDLARDRDLSRAADYAERGSELYLNSDLREIFGWLLFLDGRVQGARRSWKDLPSRAEHILVSYNDALELARRGEWKRAFDRLEEISLPFRPALILEFVCAGRVGDAGRMRNLKRRLTSSYSGVSLPETTLDREGPESREGEKPDTQPKTWRLATTTVAALVLLLLGGGAGYLISTPGTGESSSSTDDPNSVDEGNTKRASTTESPVSDSLRLGWAYLLGAQDDVANEVEGVVGAEPIEMVRPIPAGVRRDAARDWYLEGLELYQSTQLMVAVNSFKAALASVGVDSDLYWVDDALYLTMRSLEESNPTAASGWAKALISHHGSSMYINSVTRSIAEQEERGLQ